MKKAISLLLSILLLASSTNVTYAKHFCGDYEMLSVITLGQKHLTCGVKMNSNTCNDENKDGHHCCKNKYENIDIDDNFAISPFDALLIVPFIKNFISVFVLQLVKFDQQSLQFYADYDPPPLNKDIPVLYQIFII